VYAGMFDGAEHASLRPAPGRRVYLHVARGEISVNGKVLNQGDALKCTDEPLVDIASGRAAEILLFDLP
jgi:quercetin 2,3-dioxygenase